MKNIFKKKNEKVESGCSENSKLSCKAPFKSLRLGPNGRITVCCHNMSSMVGIYPDNSLKEIWAGSSINKLRNDFHLNKYPVGCEACSKTIGKNSFTINANLYDRYTSDSGHPIMLDFKADYACNLACIMCSGLSSSKIAIERTGQIYKNVYDISGFFEELRLLAPNLKEVRFSGGEPMLSEFYKKIWEILISVNSNIEIFIQTNGTILTNNLRSVFSRGRFHFNISIDSINPIKYAQIRQNSELGNVLKNIEYFKNYCQSNNRFWGMTACLMNINCYDIPDIVNFWNQHQARGWFSMVWYPAKYALWTMSKEELNKLKNYYKSQVFREDTDIEKFNSGIFKDLIHQIEFMAENSVNNLRPSPDKKINSEQFQFEILKYTSNKDYPLESDNLRIKLSNAFRAMNSEFFNLDTFKYITRFTSSGILFDLLNELSEEELMDSFSYFSIQ
jgi:MoaA/NifB/PqqE/SkfB family radical SAM enzyme